MAGKAAPGRWFRLDNAAKLYPAVSNFRWSSVFRVSAELTERVVPERLQTALERVLPRFPSMKVCLKSGLFWYYLEEMTEPMQIMQDVGHPCMPFSMHDKSYLMRVMYYENRISAEFFHSLTDGTGGMVFIKTLTAEYAHLCGLNVRYDNGALDPAEKPDAEETRDEFLRMKLPKVRRKKKEDAAYHFPGTPETPHTLNLTGASMSVQDVKRLAGKYGVTVTEYLTSVIIWCALQEQQAGKVERNTENGHRNGNLARPVRVSVPVNLRAFYSGRTLRNFSSFVNPEFDAGFGSYGFQDVANEVRAFMRMHVNRRLLCADIAYNVSAEKNVWIRLAPLFMKNMAISGVYRRSGDRLVTATFSNLGRVEKPTGTEKLIRRFEFHLGVPGSPTCNCACVSTGDELRLMFSSNIVETTLERKMLTYLTEQGVQISVESNRG